MCCWVWGYPSFWKGKLVYPTQQKVEILWTKCLSCLVFSCQWGLRWAWNLHFLGLCYWTIDAFRIASTGAIRWDSLFLPMVGCRVSCFAQAIMTCVPRKRTQIQNKALRAVPLHKGRTDFASWEGKFFEQNGLTLLKGSVVVLTLIWPRSNLFLSSLDPLKSFDRPLDQWTNSLRFSLFGLCVDLHPLCRFLYGWSMQWLDRAFAGNCEHFRP